MTQFSGRFAANVSPNKIALLDRNESCHSPFVVMARFYFHRHLNGQKTADQTGVLLEGNGAACAYAVRRMPGALKDGLRQQRADVHAATEISDGTRTLYIIRGKITVERS